MAFSQCEVVRFEMAKEAFYVAVTSEEMRNQRFGKKKEFAEGRLES